MLTDIAAIYQQGGDVGHALCRWALSALPPAEAPVVAAKPAPRRHDWRTIDPQLQALGYPGARGAITALARELAIPVGTLFTRYYLLFPPAARDRPAGPDVRAALREELGLAPTPLLVAPPVVTIPVISASPPPPVEAPAVEAPLFEHPETCPACRQAPALVAGLCAVDYAALTQGTLPRERATRLLALPPHLPVARPCRNYQHGCTRKAVPDMDGYCLRCGQVARHTLHAVGA